MRSLVLVAALLASAACSHARPSGPAWPEASKSDAADDGGESLAPHESNAIAAVIEKSDEPEPKPAADDKPAAATSTDDDDDKPTATPASATPPQDDVIMSDEIIIEIDD